MSTTAETEFDYQAYLRENPPDLTNIHRGTAEREKRLDAALARINQNKRSGNQEKVKEQSPDSPAPD